MAHIILYGMIDIEYEYLNILCSYTGYYYSKLLYIANEGRTDRNRGNENYEYISDIRESRFLIK